MLRFGTAGLRGPLRDGPDGMNVATVTAATAGLAAWLHGRCLGGGTVIVGHDARHGSTEFATATSEVLAAAGFSVLLFEHPLPTPVVAFAVRDRDAVAGIQITASHNPATDNGYKVYLSGGAQLVPPADREIEECIAVVGDPNTVPHKPVEHDPIGTALLRRYLDRVVGLPRSAHDDRGKIRIALTAMHGVGGQLARSALLAAGFTDVHVVAEQFAPDPDFPTVPFPNPEEPGATDLLLALARDIDADLAVALDPDADRCAIGVPTPTGWRMLRGDETGPLLGDYVLSGLAERGTSVVASTIVSSRLLGKLADARGARHVETLTGFKWLVRAADGSDDTLVYAYEEAIGHCVDPDAVRDKDGISAAMLAADLVACLAARGRSLVDVLDDYAVEFGVHAGEQVSLRAGDLAELARVLAALRAQPPTELAGEPVVMADLLRLRGGQRTDALIFTGPTTRMVVRPSGTEPKVKFYLEAHEPVADRADLARATATASRRLVELRNAAQALAS